MSVPKRQPPKDDPEEVCAAAVRLLARREHSTSELTRKLKERGFSNGLIEPGLERLREAGYLSDHRFAGSLARHRTAQGYGGLRIHAELSQHGLERTVIDAAIDDLDADWYEQAWVQMQRHFAQPPQTASERARILRYLTQRGFTAEVARAAVARWRESGHEPG